MHDLWLALASAGIVAFAAMCIICLGEGLLRQLPRWRSGFRRWWEYQRFVRELRRRKKAATIRRIYSSWS